MLGSIAERKRMPHEDSEGPVNALLLGTEAVRICIRGRTEDSGNSRGVTAGRLSGNKQSAPVIKNAVSTHGLPE